MILLERLNGEILWKVLCIAVIKFDDTVHLLVQIPTETSNEIFDLLKHEVHYEEIIDA